MGMIQNLHPQEASVFVPHLKVLILALKLLQNKCLYYDYDYYHWKGKHFCFGRSKWNVLTKSGTFQALKISSTSLTNVRIDFWCKKRKRRRKREREREEKN